VNRTFKTYNWTIGRLTLKADPSVFFLFPTAHFFIQFFATAQWHIGFCPDTQKPTLRQNPKSHFSQRFFNFAFINIYKENTMLSTEKTLSEVIEILRQRGYTEDFNLLEENISYKKGGEKVDLNDIVIDKIYRFTGQNDLEDEAILYAMTNQKDGAKGVFVNGYGTYTDSGANAVISKITVNENDNDDWTIK